jgi:zinc transport system ATP-binding protein
VAAVRAGTAAVSFQDVWFSFGSRLVLEAVDLRIERGAFLGVLGPNGGGKTTLLKLMLGLLKPDRGTVRVLGLPPREARGRVGYVPQYARFDADFPILVRDAVLMARLGRGRAWGTPSAADREAAQRALEQVALSTHAARGIGELSGGELQRVLVARALAVEPEVLLLDEPTSSVDPRIGRSIYQLLEQLGPDMTRIVVSHDVGVLRQHVESVACVNRKVWYHGTGELTAEIIEEAYGEPVELVTHAHRVLDAHGEAP